MKELDNWDLCSLVFASFFKLQPTVAGGTLVRGRGSFRKFHTCFDLVAPEKGAEGEKIERQIHHNNILKNFSRKCIVKKCNYVAGKYIKSYLVQRVSQSFVSAATNGCRCFNSLKYEVEAGKNIKLRKFRMKIIRLMIFYFYIPQ